MLARSLRTRSAFARAALQPRSARCASSCKRSRPAEPASSCSQSPPSDVAFSWSDTAVWRTAAQNTGWCLAGCSIGEFSTLAAFSSLGVAAAPADGALYYGLLALPLVNGILTSVALETVILTRGGMEPRAALNTALGMSMISMLVMEASMEGVDLCFTAGALGLAPTAVAPMLVAGFLAPWPYNYWRLKRYGQSCH